ncbi:hypothetical protein B9P78_02135 [Aerococcus sp. 1KP-2016]|nr:hypothetical protein B9P78_02135 [Aerococcus sp. 1KP-2016]
MLYYGYQLLEGIVFEKTYKRFSGFSKVITFWNIFINRSNLFLLGRQVSRIIFRYNTYYQSKDVWGFIGAVSFVIGLSLTIFYLDSKLEHKRLSNRFIKSVGALSILFSTWLVHKEFAYICFIFWVMGIYLLIGFLQDIILLSIGNFLKLETNYQLMIAIPLITIVLNYLLKI